MSLAEIRYQDAAVRMLRSAMAGDRVAHAYIFVGPRGVGKGLAARQFAKLLLCAKPRGTGDGAGDTVGARHASPAKSAKRAGEACLAPTEAGSLDPCDTCDHCTRIDRGTHPDLYWFRKEEDRNDFRLSVVTRRHSDESASPSVTVTESVVLYPMEAARTVTVLDDAELLNKSAANALLKTLEEPSPHAVLILLCADASQLPGTILSRCQWVRFGPLPEEFVAEKVREVLAAQAARPPEKGRKAEAPRPIAREEIAFICRFAGGSIEQAVQLAGSGLWGLKRAILPGLAAMDEADALDMAEAVASWAVTEARRRRVPKGTPEETAVRRSSARLALAVVASAFRDAAMVAVGSPEGAGLTNADQPDVIQLLASWSAESCSRAVSILADGQAQIVRYVHVELATENALVQVSRLRHAAVRV